MSIIILTKKCNLRCSHCFRTDYKGSYMDVGMLKRFLEELKTKMPGASTYALTGGEPTVHPKLDEVFAAFRDTGNETSMVSNGTYEKGVQTTIANKDVITGIDISMDCADPEANNRVRGKDAFEMMIKGIDAYVAADIYVNFVISMHDQNVPYLRKAFELADATGTNSILFIPLDPTGKGRDAGLVVTQDGMKKGMDDIDELMLEFPDVEIEVNDVGITPNRRVRVPPKNCDIYSGHAYKGLTLLPNGDVAMCCDLYDIDFDSVPLMDHYNVPVPTSLGNYATGTLKEILRTKDLHLAELNTRRREDAEAGLLENGREFTCNNCKFYHAHNNPPPGTLVVPAKTTIPIRQG